jgi:hypothetical protein
VVVRGDCHAVRHAPAFAMIMTVSGKLPCERLTQPGSRGGLRAQGAGGRLIQTTAAPQDNQHIPSITLQVRRGTTQPITQVTRPCPSRPAIVGRISPGSGLRCQTGSANGFALRRRATGSGLPASSSANQLGWDL